MDDEAARATFEVFGEGRGQNRGGRTRQDRVGRRGRVEPCEHRALHLNILRRVLLHVDGPFKGRLGTRRHTYPRRDSGGRRPVEKIARFEVRQEPFDIILSLRRRRFVLVPKDDLATGAREANRPGAADETEPITPLLSCRPPSVPSHQSQRLDIGVHADRLARYITPRWGQQVCDCRRDVARGHHSAHRTLSR